MKLRAIIAVVALASLAGFGVGCGSSDGDSSGAPSHLSDAGKRGYELATTNRCASCHSLDGAASVGPTWQGLAGSERTLSDGSTVMADTAYLTRAIADPRAEQVEGYPSQMPTYRFLSDEEVADIVVYIQELDET
ncbi:MAG: cytochrome c [Aquihabitans sp.]